MGLASYQVVPKNGSWSVKHGNDTGGDYATKEAAFEAIAAAASNAIKEGHEVRIEVPGRETGGKPALGAA